MFINFIKKFCSAVTAFAVIFYLLGSVFTFVPVVRATVTPTVTNLIQAPTTAKASSAATAAIKMVISVSAGEQLTAVTVAAADSGATSFNPATDLAALATGATSGVALYNDAGSTPGSFDATDAVVALSSASAWSSGSTTLTLASAGAAGTYYIVFKTAASPTEGHGFVLTLPANGITMSSNNPTITAVSTSAVTIDKTSPTVLSSFPPSLPAAGGSNVPIGSTIHVNFSEAVDPSTITPSNITFQKTADSSAVPFSLRVYPSGFDVVPATSPAFTASSRYAKPFTTTSGLFNITAGQSITAPSSGYTSPTNGDIVFFQHETFPMEVGVVTNFIQTGGTFAVNGFPLFGGQQLVKFGTVNQTGAVTSAASPTLGDLIVMNTTANPTSDRYNWHIVTTSGAVNAADFRLDNSSAAPSYVASSVFSTIASPTTSATDAATPANLVTASDLLQGSMIFAKVTANADNLNAYAWHLITTAENIAGGAAPLTLRLDGKTAAPTLAASSQISEIVSAGQGAMVDASPTLGLGDIIFASATAGAATLNSYAFHLVSGSGAPNATTLRLDNSGASLATGTGYTLTVGTGVTDVAGNALQAAAANTITFSTGSISSTNTTPPSVTSSTPQAGSQSFPTGIAIKLVFSQDMSAASVTNASNVGLSTDNFGAAGTAVSATRAYDSATKTLTITPSPALQPNTSYVVNVFPSALSANGAAAANFFLPFHTGSGADTTRPKVTGVFPAPAASNVALPVSDISVGFNEDMDPATITGNITISPVVTGTVSYDAKSRSGHFSPTAPLSTGTTYTVTVGTAVADLSGNGLEGNGGVANAASTSSGASSSYVFSFGTSVTADTAKPTVISANADNFSLAVTFSEGMKTGGGPNATDNISNYIFESPTGTTVSLAGKTVTYNGATQTATILGLSSQQGATFKVTVSSATQDLAGNFIDTTSSANVAQGSVLNASATGGMLGPGSGPMQDPSQFGMTPMRVTPMNRAAGATSNYSVEFPVTTSIPSLGSIVLTFPTGFDVTSANVATPTTESFRNSDINGPLSGVVTIALGSVNVSARTITLTTGGAATGAPAFIGFDLKGIVNSSVPSSAGYTVDIKTKDASGIQLQSMTSGAFFLGQAGANTLTVNVFNDDGTGGGIANNNIKDGGEAGIQNATVFLFSPAVGGQSKTTDSNGVATFPSLPSGDFMLGIEPSSIAGGNFVANTAPQPVSISTNTTKNYGLRTSSINIQGTIYGPASTSVDVFAATTTGSGGFVKRNYSTNSTSVTVSGTIYGGSVAYSLPVSSNTVYSVGVGPAMPTTFSQPGAPPPPPPTFTFMPPSNLTVNVGASSATGQDFTLTAANSSIIGVVQDSSGNGISGAMAFARPASTSTTGGQAGFGTGAQSDSSGSFTLKVTPGVYLVGVFKPGMPQVEDQQITVPTSGSNTPSSLTFKFSAGTSLTISGKITDDSNNTISYAGVSGRKVNSTTDTTPTGGGADSFVGGPADSNGNYTLYVSAGTWVVAAFAPGFGQLGTKTITVSTANVTGQDFSAATLSMGTIKGQATKANVAQQGVMVRAQGANGGNMAITDSSGNYSLKVPAGTYTVICMFPGIGESTPLTNVSVTANTNTNGQDCSLAAPITITVNLTDGTNAIANAYVDARDANGRGNGTNTSTTSGTNAVYTLVVPPGTWTVRAMHPSYGPIGTTTGVSTTQTINYTATVGTVYAITGIVTGDGSALGTAWVSLTGTPTGQTQILSLGAQTASDGTYSISVPNGSYKLRADKPGYASSAAVSVTVSGAAKTASTIALTTASQTITGTVTLSSSGVSNAFVDASDGSGGFAVAQTNSSGAYTLSVKNGTWSLRAHSKGYEAGPLTVVVNSNNPSNQTLALSAIAGFTLKPDTSETITPSSGGYLTNSNIGSAFKINIPANALGTGSNASTVTTNVNTGLPGPPSGSILKTNAILISAVDSSGQSIKTLNSPVTITIPYDTAQLPSGSSASNLVIGTWNSATQSYDTVATTVDTTAHTLTMTVSHFSDFAPLVPTDLSAPSTPSNFAIANPGTGTSGSLSWSSVSTAVSYNVYKSSDNSSFPLLASPTATSYTATGLTANTTYYFKVSAVNATGGESAATSSMSFIPTGNAGNSGGGSIVVTPTPTPTPPPAPAPAGSGSTATPAPIATPTPAPTPAPTVSAGPVMIPSLSAKPSNDELASVITAVTKQIVYIQANLKAPNILSILQDTMSKLVQVQNALSAPAAPVSSSAPLKKPLSVGSKGADVTALQNFLKSQGSQVYPGGNVTGYFGKATESALGRFQLKYGLVKSAKDTGYGYLGPKTRAKINELMK